MRTESEKAMTNEEFYIPCDGISVHIKLDLPDSDPRADHSKIPMVLAIPGLTGHMEEPHMVAIAEALPKAGYACLRAELYGHGKSGGSFHDHTLFHWALELMGLIDYARGLDYVSELYLCGHSQAGAAAVLGAGLEPDKLDGLILLAPAMLIRDVSYAGGFPVRFFDPEHIPDETLVFDSAPISGNYYRVNRLLPFDDAIRLYGDKPVLVGHSPTDELVPYEYGVRTAEAYQNAEMFTTGDDDHCFAAHIDQVTGKMIAFLNSISKDPASYRYLLFDLDGTLTDPKEGITKSVQYALRRFGIDVADPDTLTPYIGPPLIPSFMEFHGLSREQAEEALLVYRERFSTVGLFENEVLEGVPEMLRALHEKGRFLAVASSKPEEYVRRILKHFDLLQYFDEVVGASMDEKRSAKKDIIEEALRRMGKSDGDPEVLMIGDRKHDVEGAKQCGLDSLAVYTGFAPQGELEEAGATFIFRTIGEMEEFLV